MGQPIIDEIPLEQPIIKNPTNIINFDEIKIGGDPTIKRDPMGQPIN